MILADTSIWVDHFRHNDTTLAALLRANRIVMHPFIIGELLLGRLQQAAQIALMLKNLPRAVVAHDDEVLTFMDKNELAGIGIGYVDAHVLAATRLTAGASLWTRDKRLHSAAERLSLATAFANSASIATKH